MSKYTDDLRRNILMSTIATNDSFNVRTHVRVFVGFKGKNFLVEYSENLAAYFREDVVMTTVDEEGKEENLIGVFVTLSVGSKACKIVWEDPTTCYVLFSLNQSPAFARFKYGCLAAIYTPDIPMSEVSLGFLVDERSTNAPKEETKKPALRLVK